MSAERRKSPLFRGEIARSNSLLARSLFKELLGSGRTRAEIIDFINCLLGLVARENGRTVPLLVDRETGFPTRVSLLEILRHELDASRDDSGACGLIICEASGELERLMLARMVRQQLRERDIIVPLSDQRVAAVVYCPGPLLPAVTERLRSSIVRSVAPFGAELVIASVAVEPGALGRVLLRRAFAELRSQWGARRKADDALPRR